MPRNNKNKILRFLVIIILFLCFKFPVYAGDTAKIKINIRYANCYDGIDNDGDGFTDFPDDPDCTSETDNNEQSGTDPDPATVTFIGRAYPTSEITILRDGQIGGVTLTGADANFKVTLRGFSEGNYVFSLYGEDKDGVRSSLYTFLVSITESSTVTISGIFIAPTISVNKSEVKRGENVAIFGQTTPSSEVTIVINSSTQLIEKVNSIDDGTYLYNLDTLRLEAGSHTTKSKTALNSEISPYSDPAPFKVTEVVPTGGGGSGGGGNGNGGSGNGGAPCIKADLNCDGRVNLIDFSIEAYWYQRATPPSKYDLNSDGKIDLIDFSIMAYYWTG